MALGALGGSRGVQGNLADCNILEEIHLFHYKSNVMHYYNAKSKVIMKGRRSRGVRRSRRGGWWQGDAVRVNLGSGGVGAVYKLLGGGKRTFRKRTCRSKSRCGGANWSWAETARHSSPMFVFRGGSRGVRRSRRGGAKQFGWYIQL